MVKNSGLFGLWLRFGSVTGFFKPAPSPKPRQSPKILAPNWLQHFFKRSKPGTVQRFERDRSFRRKASIPARDAPRSVIVADVSGTRLGLSSFGWKVAKVGLIQAGQPPS